MKRLVVFQTILLFLTILFGILIKNGIALEITKYHGLVAKLSGFAVLTTLITSFIRKYQASIKSLSFSLLIFTVLAAFSGMTFSDSGNYFYFNLMVIAGTTSFVLSLLLWKWLTNPKS